MDPPQGERISWRTSLSTGVDVPALTATMARAAAALALGGASVAVLGLALPHDPDLDERLLGALALLTLLGCALLLAGSGWLPRWSFQLFAAGATFIASAVIYAWGSDSVYGPLPYLWVVVYVCWYFRPSAAAAHLALVGLSYATVLGTEGVETDALGGYASTMGTLAVAAYLIFRARERVAYLLADLTDAVRRDPLTGLLNRRGFEEAFDLEIERCRRNGSTLGLVVADIDRFKSVNDALGHGAGDAVLRRVGELMCSTKRRFDSAARTGGEEFAIVLPDTDEHGAYVLAERIRTSMEKREANLTVSLGVACLPLHGTSTDALLEAADQALYAAKRLGRNRSVLSSAEVPGILALGAESGREHGFGGWTRW